MLVASKPVSCSPECCVQLVLHQGRAETTSATQKCHPTKAEFDRIFTLPADSRFPLSGHFATARNSGLDHTSRSDHPLLRRGTRASATLLLPHPLPSSFMQHKQFQACNKLVHVAVHYQRFSRIFAP